MKITMKRGELFQIAQNSLQIRPAKPAHAERFRLAVEAIASVNDELVESHRAEVNAAQEAIPEKERSDKAVRAVAQEIADREVVLEIDPKDLQAYTAATVAVWTLPGDEQGRGMPYAILRSLSQDLKALKVWGPWGIAQKVAVDDPEIGAAFPLDALDDGSIEDEFPTTALEA